MTLEQLRSYCLAKAGVTEETPFDQNTLVYKVLGKMFCLADMVQFDSINVKADPALSAEWREQYDQVIPGWHMNKTHWNTVFFERMPTALILQMIDHSYSEVVRKLPMKHRNSLGKNS